MGQINVTWWNLQNFFDTDDDPISRDFEYTAAHGWTEEVFAAKKRNLAEALRATHGGAGPDLLAVAEIEKDELLAALVAEIGNPALTVAEDPAGTQDLRGIDVALAYDRRKLALTARRSHTVHLRYATRDIFEAVFEVRETGETLVVIAGHWPSRRLGRYESEPLRIAVAENIAHLVQAHVKLGAREYEALRDRDDLQPVLERWEAKVLVLGDFNDEPADRSVVDHLNAARDLTRVIGVLNGIDRFDRETADYRARPVFLYNPMWRFLPQPDTGSYYLAALRSGVKIPNRYQVLDQLVASRGLVSGAGLHLDLDSVAIFQDPLVATPSRRPRPFDKRTRKGTSDHLPITAVLRYNPPLRRPG
ncbi:MAG TPA: hypothetical protein VGA00_14145 [Acidiferrobacterales bacterium]|jgi:endonuclease/exonuclease/phosphatase family metal-dependent hydrolase